MTTFLLGNVLSIVPGLIMGWIGWSVVGGLMRHYSYCRHPASAQIVASASISASAERVRTEPPLIVKTTQVERPSIPQIIVMPVLMPPIAPLDVLPQYQPAAPIVLEIPELASGAITR